jgi:membrane protein implicated in regulation of membrane protease activity
MNNPVLKFFLLRMGLFVVTLGVLSIFVHDVLLAALFAAVISFALSVVLLRRQRDELSTHVYNRINSKRDGLNKPGTEDTENDLLDGKGE